MTTLYNTHLLQSKHGIGGRFDGGTERVFGNFCTCGDLDSRRAPDTGRSFTLTGEHASAQSGMVSGAALANPVWHPRMRLVPQLSTVCWVVAVAAGAV